MSDSQKNRWKSLSIEATAIVVSILLAFAIDAWWEERQTEQDIIEDLAIVESSDLLIELKEIQLLVQAEVAQ